MVPYVESEIGAMRRTGHFPDRTILATFQPPPGQNLPTRNKWTDEVSMYVHSLNEQLFQDEIGERH